jgi:N-acetyl-anhydromuramyl-L-alanine amidase AmpD
MITIRKNLRAKYLAARKRTVQGIVLHDTYGSGTHNDTRYLANPGDGRQVSTDFTVERDGTIYQLNPDLRRYATFHAGRATSFKGVSNGLVNHATIGIEIVQHKNLSLRPVYPDAQIRAVAGLCSFLCSEFGLTVNDITTHKQIIQDGSRTDPREFPFNDFYRYFGSPAPVGSNNTAYIVAGLVAVLLLM